VILLSCDGVLTALSLHCNVCSRYFSKKVIDSEGSAMELVLPDLKNLPTTL
jgi:hypothetical protein